MESENRPTGSLITLEPTVTACYRNGWRQMKRYFLDLLLLIAISIVIVSISGLPLTTEYDQVVSNNYARQTSLFTILYLILLHRPVSYGITYAFLKAARNESPEIQSVLEVLKNYTSAVMAGLLTFTIIGIGIGLLIIPGLIFGCRLAFVPYLVVEEKMDSIESVKMSWQLSRGHTFTLLGIGMVAVLIYLVGLIAFGVGIILSMIWVKLAVASMYHAVAFESEDLKNYGLAPDNSDKSEPGSQDQYSGSGEGRLRNMLDEKKD